MLAFEALNTAPKTPKANLKQEDIKENTTLSFDSLLKSITKKDKTDAETTLILIPREKDTKTQLLDLLKSSSKTQVQQEKDTKIQSLDPLKSPSKIQKPQEKEPKTELVDLLKSSSKIQVQQEKDTKTQSLDLLKSPSKIQEQQEKVIETALSKNNNTPDAEVKETNLDKLLQLLKSDDPKEIKELKTPLEINPDVSEKLSPSELKDLIYKAKKYLKEKIEANPEFAKKYDPKELPNNIKSLVTIAKELKIDIKNITYENITEKDLKQTKDNKQLETDFIDDISNEKIKSPKKQIAQQPIIKQETKTVTKETSLNNNQETIKETVSTKLESVKNTPILKEVQTTITTQHIINSKELKNTTKQEATQNDLLKKLLKSDTKKNDLSIQENKIQQKNDINNLFQTKQTETSINEDKLTKKQTLEELLRNEISSEQSSEIKPIQTHKSDSVEVKINEAKQMMKYLSQDIKKAIDDYKPPFTRLKVQLNPQKLGEVDLTVIQRGNNVHVNLSSNNAALNILANNLNELKTQLNQNGINNASFNFNSQGDQKQDQGHQRAKQEYSYFAQNNEKDENLQELEIIVPRYI